MLTPTRGLRFHQILRLARPPSACLRRELHLQRRSPTTETAPDRRAAPELYPDPAFTAPLRSLSSLLVRCKPERHALSYRRTPLCRIRKRDAGRDYRNLHTLHHIFTICTIQAFSRTPKNAPKQQSALNIFDDFEAKLGGNVALFKTP